MWYYRTITIIYIYNSETLFQLFFPPSTPTQACLFVSHTKIQKEFRIVLVSISGLTRAAPYAPAPPFPPLPRATRVTHTPRVLAAREYLRLRIGVVSYSLQLAESATLYMFMQVCICI